MHEEKDVLFPLLLLPTSVFGAKVTERRTIGGEELYSKEKGFTRKRRDRQLMERTMGGGRRKMFELSAYKKGRERYGR